MSVNCIELSSDEEVELVTEQPILLENGSSTENSKSTFSALERLKKNSSIELTIDLDSMNKNDKITMSEPNRRNGYKHDSQLFQLLTTKTDCKDQKVQNISSEIIVIDDKDEKESTDKDVKLRSLIEKEKLSSSSCNSRDKSVSEKDTSCLEKKIISSDIIIIDDKEEKVIRKKKRISKSTNRGNNNTVPNNSIQNSIPEKLSKVKGNNEIYVIDDDEDDPVTTVKDYINNVKIAKNSSFNSGQAKVLSGNNKNADTSSGVGLPGANNVQDTLNMKKVVLCLSKTPGKPPVPINKLTSNAGTIKTPTTGSHLMTRKLLLNPVVSLPSKLPSLPNQSSSFTVTGKSEPEKLPVRELRSRQRTEPERDPLALKPAQQASSRRSKASDTNSSGQPKQTSSKASVTAEDELLKRLRNEKTSREEPSINSYSVENMFDGLVKSSCKILKDENLATRLWKYFRSAAEVVQKSDDFLNALKMALKSSEEVKNPTIEDQVIVSRNLKEVMRILKRQPERINKNLRKLNRILQLLNERIHKLEEMEVTSSSGEESENVYCLLDRHRARAAKIYSKICELEGKAAHAGRPTLQRFHFVGKSGYTNIEQAVERYYHKTKRFPDFMEVKKLIEATIDKEKLQIPPVEIHSIAESIFLEFGNKLQRRRKCDDYSMLVDYLDDGTKDPALDDEELFRKLDENKKNRKKEEDVFAEFVRKHVELKTKGEIKSDEEGDNSDGVESSKEDEESHKKHIQFSDTEDELINEDVTEGSKKRKFEIEDKEEPSSQRHKKTMSELDQMEVNLKLVADVQQNRVNSRRNSADKDSMMDQLEVVSKANQQRI